MLATSNEELDTSRTKTEFLVVPGIVTQKFDFFIIIQKPAERLFM
jgi:hypothetical protein